MTKFPYVSSQSKNIITSIVPNIVITIANVKTKIETNENKIQNEDPRLYKYEIIVPMNEYELQKYVTINGQNVP